MEIQLDFIKSQSYCKSDYNVDTYIKSGTINAFFTKYSISRKTKKYIKYFIFKYINILISLPFLYFWLHHQIFITYLKRQNKSQLPF